MGFGRRSRLGHYWAAQGGWAGPGAPGAPGHLGGRSSPPRLNLYVPSARGPPTVPTEVAFNRASEVAFMF